MNFSIIIPTFHSEILSEICVKSFNKFCPNNVGLDFVIVENSDDCSYKKKIEGCIDGRHNVLFINNKTHYIGSEANADAIKIGLKHVKNQWIFMVHCDTCVVSEIFYDAFISKIQEGNMLIGTYEDINRIHALHISGLIVNKEIANVVDYFPFYKNGKQVLDVGDKLTKFCRETNIKHCCFDNTFGYHNITLDKNHKFYDIYVCKCVYNNEVIYMHLGRGISKTIGTYHKTTGCSLDKWIKFIKKEIL